MNTGICSSLWLDFKLHYVKIIKEKKTQQQLTDILKMFLWCFVVKKHPSCSTTNLEYWVWSTPGMASAQLHTARLPVLHGSSLTYWPCLYTLVLFLYRPEVISESGSKLILLFNTGLKVVMYKVYNSGLGNVPRITNLGYKSYPDAEELFSVT